MEPNTSGRVVLLTGPSSTGKSTVARTLQELLAEPFLVIGIDTFLRMVPSRLKGPEAEAGFRWVGDEHDHGRVRIVRGPYGRKVVRGMQATVALLARSGLNLIVEDVVVDSEKLAWWSDALGGIDVLLVRLDAPLEVLRERESRRQDRVPGTAAGSMADVFGGTAYDVTIDASRTSPEEAAREIARAMAARRPSNWRAAPDAG